MSWWFFDEEMNSQELLGKLKRRFDVSSWLSEGDRALNTALEF